MRSFRLSFGVGHSCTPLQLSVRSIIVPKQLKAYGGTFSPSDGDRSDHLTGNFVLQKVTNSTRSKFKSVKTSVANGEDFSAMGLPAEVRSALGDMEVFVPSPIQQSAIEVILQKKDTLLAAPNGEGKTVAFLAPLYANMLKDKNVYKIPLRERRPRMILLAPTQELVMQLQHVASGFDARTGLKSVAITTQKRAAYHINKVLKTTMPDVLILHPRTALKLVRAKRLFLDDLRYVCVDEADTMLSPQHDHDASRLTSKILQRKLYKHLWPVETQFVFSSPFITRNIEHMLTKKFPHLVPVFRKQAMHLPSRSLTHRFYPMYKPTDKMDTLIHLLKKNGHEVKSILTDEDESRVATTFTPLVGSFGLGGVDDGEVPSEGRRTGASKGANGSEADDDDDMKNSDIEAMMAADHEQAAAEASSVLAEGDGNEGCNETVARAAGGAVAKDGAIDHDHVSAKAEWERQKEHRKVRYEIERVKPTAWEHLTTMAAPFTCHIPRSTFNTDSKRTMIFFGDTDACIAIYHRLKNSGFTVALLHASLPWDVRREQFRRFASGECNILCCTDVASRGLDIHIDLVINFNMPTNAALYLSRCGRAGRMGRPGAVCSLYSKQQGVIVSVIRAFTAKDVALSQISNWKDHMMKPRYTEWKGNKMNALARSYVSMITTKTIPAHLERTYLRHNATWRPIFHPDTVDKHAGVHPNHQRKVSENVMSRALDFRRVQLAKRKGGRAKFGSSRGVWNDVSGARLNSAVNQEQNPMPAGDFVPSGPPK